MRNADAGLEVRGVGPQGCEAATGPLGKRAVGRIERVAGSAPFRPCGARGALDKIGRTVRLSPRRSGERSGAATRNVWLSGPAGNHGVGILVEPLVEQGRDLLAEIGGVTESGEFVALQGVAGSGEKELPGWLGAIGIHGALRRKWITYSVRYRNSSHSMITSNNTVTALWKNAESEEISARACSGCAGDYEDPDRSAWEEDFEEGDGELLEEAGDEPGPDE